MEKLKKCFKCGEVKPLSEFYVHKEMADGHLGKCIECTKKDVHLHRANNIEKIREYDRKRSKTKRRKKMRKLWDKSYRKNNPEKRHAHSLLGHAIKSGKIKKLPCEICGSTKNIHGHHDDYYKPLEVRWLCTKHHLELHKKKRRYYEKHTT